MFAGSSLMSGLDRLSIRSVLTGSTGSILGVFASVVLIVLCFIFFLGPTIAYFQGDYIQSTFKTLTNLSMMRYSGCDFKMAISFHSKATAQPVNHQYLSGLLETKAIYTSPSGQNFEADLNLCDPQYFKQMENPPHEFKSNECFTIPDKLGYESVISDNSQVSLFGFKFKKSCSNPIICTFNSPYLQDENSLIANFFQDHYYVLYFTSNVINQYGSLELKWNRVFSTEWQDRDSIIPVMYAFEEIQTMYMDNSIMPWVNNQTITHPVWYGVIQGININEDQLQFVGVRTAITTSNVKNISFREYKKLDWLLGMLGGGFFLLYLFFWALLNYINTTKQKIQTCQSMLLTYDAGPPEYQSLKKVSINKLYYLVDWIPFPLPFLKRQRKLIQHSQHMLDIVNLVKKQKIALRNLRFTAKLQSFEPKRLVEGVEEQKQFPEQLYDSKYQLPQEHIQIIQNQRAVPLIYQTNSNMLMLNNTEAGKYAYDNNEQFQKISKQKVRKFENKKNLCQKILGVISKIILQFDVFAAKPNLTQNKASSFLGCAITLLVIILAIVTFALTIGNMGVTKIYMDQIYESGQNFKVEMVTGEDFKMALCVLNEAAFTNNVIVGEDRVADVKFFQYSRDGSKEQIRQMRALWIRDLNYPYFDFNSLTYNYVQMKSCFRPEDGENLTVMGSDQTEKQMYFGATVKPFCTGDVQYCTDNADMVNTNFFSFLNTYPMAIILPQNKYFPEDQRIFSNPIPVLLSQPTFTYDLNYSKSLQQTIFLDSLHLVNDTSSWIVGDTPAPYLETLTISHENTDVTGESISTQVPYYRIKVSPTGKTQRVIFSNYKIDFLLATIGGCFIFYFLIFSCPGRTYNEYAYKAKLADVLYEEDDEYNSFCTILMKYLNMPCCKDEVIRKIQNDLDTVNLAQRVDNAYHLSTVGYSSLIEKNLSLVFLKERIKQDELVIPVQEEEQEEDDDEDDFQIQWQAYKQKQKLKLKKKTANSTSVANASDQIMENEATMQKIILAKEERMESQPLVEQFPPERNRGKLNKFVKAFDLFKNSPGLTLDGKRSVKSHCGAICCIILLVFIIILTQHFMTVYFSDFHFVSNERQLIDGNLDQNLKLTTGKNFKFMVSFIKADDFNFQNVSSITDEVAVQIVKVKIKRGRIDGPQTEEYRYNMVHCPRNYVDGFISEYEDASYYKDIQNAYCVPDNMELSIKGNPLSEEREYFKFSIRNKYGSGSTFGNQKLSQLLQNYIPQYHVSSTIQDYNSNKIKYRMQAFTKTFIYQSKQSRYFNVTLIKTEVRYDTAVNPGNQIPTINTYILENQAERIDYLDVVSTNLDQENQLSFVTEDYINVHTVKKIKVNELFGIIGGAILFVYFGLGYFPRSFNQFRMRFIIGARLYLIMGKKRTSRRKKHKGKSIHIQSQEDDVAHKYHSQLQLLVAWLLSFWGFVTNNYNGRKNIRLISLIQSRVANDISLVEFYKRLQSCEISFKRMKLLGQHKNIDLTKVYAKKIEPFVEERLKAKKIDEELIEAAKVNRFSDWDINTIMEARKKTESGQKIRVMFFEKWLDKYFGIVRSGSSRPGSAYSGSSYAPSVHWASAGMGRGIQRDKISQSQDLSIDQSDSRVNKAIAQVDEDNYDIE